MRSSALLLCWLLLPNPGAAEPTGGGAEVARAEEEEESAPELLGRVTREEIEATVPDWIEAEIAARPDAAATAALLDRLPGVEIEVLLGTWCSDSRRELARLWRAFDDAGAEHPAEIRYVGVDRSKSEPSALVDGTGLSHVPTFIVRRDGRELGRIVESSPGGIEHDLGALVAGDLTGLVTASEELLEGEGTGESGSPR